MPKPSVWCWGGRSACLYVAFTLFFVFGAASNAHAGGAQFPADGPRNLGRGGSGMARADDPTVMLRNPALLADLWDDQALLSAHVGLVDACFTPTGSALWQSPGGDERIDLGDGPFRTRELQDEPLARLCYDGPFPFTPAVAFSSKLADDLGVGIGFFPPEQATLLQWGDRDGTYETPNGRRLNPLRYLGTHQNVTYFSLLGAVGYRPLSWLRVGFGFQWALAVADATTFGIRANGKRPADDVRADVFLRDLFIPGLIASVHVVPIEELDLAFGVKWSDRIGAKAKFDFLASPFAVPDPLRGTQAPTPSWTTNQSGEVDAPPIWSPQLSASIRYAQRLRPRPQNWKASRESADGVVEDHMANERFDVELTAVYYLNSVYNRIVSYSDPRVSAVRFQSADGTVTPISFGRCVPDTGLAGGGCTQVYNPIPFGGKDQISLRLGGDYNILPGRFTVRAGASYESDGAERGYLNPRQYMFQRVGIHGGMTFRIFGKTDVHLAYAHFLQDTVRVQVNEEGGSGLVRLPDDQKTPEYNYKPGEHDGIARVPLVTPREPLSNFANAGSFFYNLDIFSIAVTQHF